DLRPGFGIGAAYPAGTQWPDERPHHIRYCAPAVDDRERRPDSGDGQGTDCRERNPSAVARPAGTLRRVASDPVLGIAGGVMSIVNAWYRGSKWLWLLWPLSLLYRALSALRRRRLEAGRAPRPQWPPLVVVGNITVG